MHARHNMKNYFYFRHYNFDITKVDFPLIFFVSCMKYANFQYSGKRHIYLVRVFVCILCRKLLQLLQHSELFSCCLKIKENT